MPREQVTSVEVVGNPNDPDLVYYNADIIANGQNEIIYPQIGDTTQVYFNETRSVPLLSDVSAYVMSVVRFTSNCGLDLPLFIPTIVIGQPDINLTSYVMTLNMTKIFVDGTGTTRTFNNFATRHIMYETETAAYQLYNAPLPPPPLTQQQINTPYYYVYTYDHFCYLVNKTAKLLIADLQALYTAYQGTFTGPYTNPTIISQAPVLTYDPTSNLFSNYFDANGYGDATTNNSTGQLTYESFTFSYNGNLFNLLANFDNNFVGTLNLNSQVNQLKVVNKCWSNYIPPVTGGPANILPQPSTSGYWKMTQTIPSTSNLWTPIASLVFCSSLLPSLNENNSAPTVYGGTNNNILTTSSNNYQPIITDVSIDMYGGAGDNRTFTVYNPSAEYRLISLTRSSQSLSNIDITVYWKSRLTGELIPVRMTNYSNVSIKILFRKRNL